VPQTQFPNGIARRWWTLKGDDAANSVAATLSIMSERHRARVHRLVDQARLYGNLAIWGLTGFSYQMLRAAVNTASPGRITHNVCQSCCDTITSKVAKNKIKSYFLTKKGDFAAQRKAKKLNDYTDGIAYETGLRELQLEAFRDSTVWGDGILYIGELNGRVHVERVPPSQVYVDEWEGMNRRPRQAHRVMLVDRSVAMDAWPKGERAIKAANTAQDVANSFYPTVSDLIEIRESWHLASSPDAKDGKHLISVGGTQNRNGTLVMDDWKHDWLPLVRMSWAPKPLGYWSQGLVEQLEGIQIELNKLLRLCQKSHDLAGSWKFLKHVGSHVVDEHVSAQIGAIVEWAGEVEPKYVLPPHVPPEVYEQIEKLKEAAYRQSGISELSASSEKPAGLDSQPSLRAYADLEADRFRTIERYWQDFVLECDKRCISLSKDIAEENKGKYEVKVPGKKFLRTMDWKEINLEDDEYIMQAYPISALRGTPEDNLATVQEWAQAGIIPQRHVPKLLDFPDVQQYASLATSEEDWIGEVLDKIVDEGELTQPEPFDNLDMAMEMALQYYAQGKCNGLEEERLDLLRDFMVAVQAQKQRAMPPPSPMGPPQAAPAPPPQSPLLPNAPVAGQAPGP
jgi:hypothetical protein